MPSGIRPPYFGFLNPLKRHKMAIETLTALFSPPDEPLGTTGDWDAAEWDLGIALPADFKDLIRVYGSGTFGGVGRFGGVGVFNPLRQEDRDTLRFDIQRFRDLREACEFNLALFPESPGFLPWGLDCQDNLYCWWVDGPPDKWTVAQIAHEEEETPHHVAVGITEFLTSFFLNRYPHLRGGWTFAAEDLRFQRE